MPGLPENESDKPQNKHPGESGNQFVIFPQSGPCRRCGYHLSASAARITSRPDQIGLHLGSVLIPDLPVFLQRLRDDVFQVRRQIRIQADQRGWRPVQDGIEDGPGGVPLERKESGRHLVQQNAERKQVSASVQRLSQHLLRRHVGDRAQRRAGTGEIVLGNRGRSLRIFRRDLTGRTDWSSHFRQAKIQNLGVAALGDENIRRLDVAVDDAFGVGGIEPVRNLDG